MSAHKSHHRWRENIEALVMAIVVALLFKYFVLEISKIPSGSMQPTLMGLTLNENHVENGPGKTLRSIYDRTLVDKLSFHFRDPKRFEIVVFKHPLERSRIMVKRLVGMPGEDLKIEYGDLWTRAGDDDPWHHLRRPASVQRAAWRELLPDPQVQDWSKVLGKDWLFAGDSITARGDGSARFRDKAGPITDRYGDGFPSALMSDMQKVTPSRGTQYVGDVRLEGGVRSLAGTTEIAFELTEGLRSYRFSVPGPNASPDAEIRVRIRDSVTSSERLEHGPVFRLEAGTRVDFALENLDDRLALDIDGETMLAAEIASSANQETNLTLEVAGAGADFDALRVSRDVYYQAPVGSRWTVRIPPGNYVMLGDNTQNSADGRLWKAKTYSYHLPDGTVVEARGNYREGNENPTPGHLGDNTPAIRFRDRWGEIHWFERGAIDAESLPGNEPLVLRELILGRALAVFWPVGPLVWWPLPPRDWLWRVGWLH